MSLPWWQTVWMPVLVIVMTAAGGAALTIWRDSPITSAEVRELKSEVVAIKAKDVSQDQSIQQLDKAVLLQSGEVRTNREQIESLRKSMEKIESYYGATLREIQALNVAFAEVRGGLQQQDKLDKKRGSER
jgi:predicted  nucleic acid-binding Zn-ribbon protein